VSDREPESDRADVDRAEVDRAEVDESSAFGAEIPEALAGERLDRSISLLCGISRAEAAAALLEGRVLLDGVVVGRGGRRLAAGSRLVVFGRTASPPVVTEDPLVLRYLDRWLAVVDKPAGLVVHRGAGVRGVTLADLVRRRFPEVAGVGEPGREGLVHRLDRETSGLLLVARSEPVRRKLAAALAARHIRRTYLAVVDGVMADDRGTVDGPIGRSPRDRRRMAVRVGGRPARTHYEVLARTDRPARTLLQVTLETGRTHQIRVHLSAIGHPVSGDRLYASRSASPGRPWLHAAHLALSHPVDGRPLAITAPLPEDLARGEGDLAPLVEVAEAVLARAERAGEPIEESESPVTSSRTRQFREDGVENRDSADTQAREMEADDLSSRAGPSVPGGA